MGKPGIAGNDELQRGVWDSDPTIVAYDASTASAQLTEGVYYMTATTNCHFKQGASNVAATTSSNYLAAGQTVRIVVRDTTNFGYVAVIKNATAGNAYIMKPSGG